MSNSGIFNFAVLLSYYLMLYVFGLKEVISEVEAFRFGIWVLWILANVVFLIYDFALTRVDFIFYLPDTAQISAQFISLSYINIVQRNHLFR